MGSPAVLASRVHRLRAAAFTLAAIALACLAGVARAGPDLAVTIKGEPDSVQPGASGSDLLAIEVTLTNNGPGHASAQVDVTLPAGLAIPPGLSAVPTLGSWDPQTSRWSISLLAAGGVGKLVIPTRAASNASGCLVTEARATFANGTTVGDLDDSNNTARLATGAPNCADLVVSSSRKTTVDGNCGNVVHTMTVTNNGPSTATSVTLSITRYQVTSPAGYSEAACNGGNVTVPGPQSANLGTIDAGSSADYAVGFYNLPVDGPNIDVSFAFNAAGAEPDPDTADNAQSGTYTIKRPLEEDDDSNWICVATSGFTGTSMQRYLPDLRRFRDRVLMRTAAGRAVVRWYYAVSPPIARQMARHESLRVAVRVALTPVVYAVCYPVAMAALLAALLLAAIGLPRAEARRAMAWR